MADPHDVGFEAGVRFALERVETGRLGTGDPETQFGAYQLSMEKRPVPLLPGSAAHLERRIRAILHLAQKEGLLHG